MARQERERQVDMRVTELLEELEAEGGEEGEPEADGGAEDPLLAHLEATQLANEALSRWQEEGACVLRGVDGDGEMHPLSAPSPDRRSSIVPGGRARLLLYAATVTATVADGRRTRRPQDGEDTQERERWAAQFGHLAKPRRQRRRRGYTRCVTAAQVMVDSGASRNFVSRDFVRERQLKTWAAEQPMSVTLADGTKIVADRMVAVTLDLQGFRYTQAMHVLPLNVSAAVILGTPFLEAISPFWCDLRHDARTIEFRHQGRTFRLRPTPEAVPGAETLSLRKAMVEIRKSRKLQKTAPEDTALAYLCVLLPARTCSREEEDGSGGTQPPSDAGPELDPEPEPPPKAPREEASDAAPSPSLTLEAIARLTREAKRGASRQPPAEVVRALRERLRELGEGGGTDALPEVAGELIAQLERMVALDQACSEEVWTEEARRQLARLVEKEFEEIIREELPILEGPEIDHTKVPAAIRFKEGYKGETPFRPGVKLSPADAETCRTILLDLLQKGYIRPSSSPFGAPILIVPKPGQPGKMRMVVDYRALNLLTESDRYPLPTIDALMQQMAGARIFSTLDLLNGFWQMPLLEEHKERTAMTTTLFGSFEWNVLPMGLKNSPAIFQRNMAELFRDLSFVAVYIDDIIVFSRTTEEHLQHVRVVMQRLRQAKVSIKGSKANLFRDRVNFLGHVVSGEGVAPQRKKVEAVMQWPTPENVSDVRSFLGLASFYRKFVHHFAAIATPLHDLTKAGAEWQWRPDREERAFRMLQQALTSAPLLVLPDVQAAASGRAPYLVQCDASLLAWGAVLMQDQGKGYQPIAFLSKAFNSAQVNYSATERELAALVMTTCEEWRHYLFGVEYELQGDHRPLGWLLSPGRELSRRQARWITQLLENDVPAMKWVPGKRLVVPDALSRRPDLVKEQPPPRQGIRLETGGGVTVLKDVEDPEDSLEPVDPLRQGYALPESLAHAPRAADIQGDPPQAAPRPAGTSGAPTGTAAESGPEEALVLREAELLYEDGADMLSADVLHLLGTAGVPGEGDAAQEADHSGGDAWLEVASANGMSLHLPAGGPGSLSHAFETLATLATGAHIPSELWEADDRHERHAREPRPPPRLWEQLAAVDEALTTDNQQQRPSWRLLRRDQHDWTFRYQEFDRWQRELGPYDVDGCCDVRGRNRQKVAGGAFWHECLQEAWDGRLVWANPPFDRGFVVALLRHLHRCRSRDPATGATIILPKYLADDEPVRKQMGRMRYLRKVHEYPAGEELFYAADGTLLETRWEVQVWHAHPDRDTLALSEALPEATPGTKGCDPTRCQYCGQGPRGSRGRLQPCLECGTAHHPECLRRGHSEPHLCDECETGVRKALELEDPREEQDIDTQPAHRQPQLLEQMKEAAAKDPLYQQWSRDLDPKVFRRMGGLLWRIEGGGLQLVVPDDVTLKDLLLQQCHASAAAGHMGTAKTYERVARRFWWNGVRADVVDYVSHCPACQRNKHRRRDGPRGVLHPVPLPSRRFEVVSMDFVTGLPRSEDGYDAILTLTDKLTKLVRLIPLRFGESTSSAEEVARLFVDHWWRHHGMPAKLMSDRDSRFCSAFWQEFARLTGAQAAMTTSFHPQANGQAENTNQTMEAVLRAYVDPRQTDWSRRLTAVEFSINDSVHTSTGYTPFQLVYGESPLSHLDLFLQCARQEERRAAGRSQQQQLDAARRFTEKWRRDLADARLKLERAQLLQKLYYDRRRKQVTYEVGDRLLISKKHLTLPADRDLPWKLRALWDGPYPVTQVLKAEDGTAFAYKVDLPAPVRKTGLHDVFTADKVVKYREDSRWPSQQMVVPEPEVVEGEREYYVDRIIRHRDVLPRGRAKRGEAKKRVREYLVLWRGAPVSEAQWRRVEDLNVGGVLGPWRDYEQALMRQDPALLSEDARRVLEDEGVLPPRAPDHPPGEAEPSPAGDATPSPPQRPTTIARAAPAAPAGAPETAGPQPRRSARLRQGRTACLVADWEKQLAAERAVAQYEAELCVVANPVRRALVLFSGSGSVERGLRERFPGIEIMSLDIDPSSAATRVCDIREFVKAEMFEYPPGHFDMLWASPPCTEYSRALTTRPRELPAADQLVASALACLLHLRPRYWFLENPDGHLQHRPLMQPLRPYLHKVAYCRYGTPYRKNTCIWSNVADLQLRQCNTRTPCRHVREQGTHPRTAQSGPSQSAPGSGAGKRVYGIPLALLQQLFSQVVL
jgi:hypothetical protein